MVKKIEAYLTENDYRLLEMLVRVGLYESKSEALRSAFRQLASAILARSGGFRHLSKETVEKLRSAWIAGAAVRRPVENGENVEETTPPGVC